MMNRYGQMVLDHNRQHRPDNYSQILDPDVFFARAGEAIAAEVTLLRDRILGPPRTGENAEAYRVRSYEALATAEELTLADHHLLLTVPTPGTDEDWSDDPDLDCSYRDLAEINRVINAPL
jgi:hypothetical protein